MRLPSEPELQMFACRSISSSSARTRCQRPRPPPKTSSRSARSSRGCWRYRSCRSGRRRTRCCGRAGIPPRRSASCPAVVAWRTITFALDLDHLSRIARRRVGWPKRRARVHLLWRSPLARRSPPQLVPTDHARVDLMVDVLAAALEHCRHVYSSASRPVSRAPAPVSAPAAAPAPVPAEQAERSRVPDRRVDQLDAARDSL